MIRPRAAQNKHRFGKKEDSFFYFLPVSKALEEGKPRERSHLKKGNLRNTPFVIKENR